MRVISLLIVVLLSCRGTNRENSQVHAAGPIDTAFKKEIPSGGYTYALDKSKEKQLGLEGIESGFDSLQIRLWVDYALSKRRELYIIKKNPQAIWSAVVYKMLVEKTLNSDSERIISKSIKTGRPKSGWDHLYSSLSILKIETLPDMKDIPGLVDNWDDGVDYTIEFATRHSYRYYGYHMPEQFQDNFWQARNMTQIISLMRTELDE